MKEQQPSKPSVMIREPGLRNRVAGGSMFPGGLTPAAEDSAAAEQQLARGECAGSLRRRQQVAGEQLLGMGKSLRVLAVTVIVVLSLGVAVLLYTQLRQNAAVAEMLDEQSRLIGGFGFLMLLTVIYLVSKHWSTSRNQRVLIDRILEEEAVARALRQNPITDFHHPEVCRDILTQQASHAARLHAPLSLLEWKIAGLGRLSQGLAAPMTVGELVRQIKGLCRATDSVLRWTPDSFLLVFPEVTQIELAAISERLKTDLETWMGQHFEESARPALEWRGASSSSLDSGGDILLETQRLLEHESRLGSRKAEPARAGARRDKSIALRVELEITGEDPGKKFFERRVVTERVAADRFWCRLDLPLMDLSPLTVSAPDGAFCTPAVLIGWTDREGEHLAEIQFNNTPDRWVIRADS